MSRPTESELRDIAFTPFSVPEVLSKLNLHPVGGNNGSLKRTIFSLNRDLFPFTHLAWNKSQKQLNVLFASLEV